MSRELCYTIVVVVFVGVIRTRQKERETGDVGKGISIRGVFLMLTWVPGGKRQRRWGTTSKENKNWEVEILSCGCKQNHP